jgi:hypothetical protein
MVVKAENWQWSSYRNTVGLEESPGWLRILKTACPLFFRANVTSCKCAATDVSG